MKRSKPIATSILLTLAFFALGIVLLLSDQILSAILSFILAGGILTMNLILVPCATLFLKEKVKQQDLDRYKSLAISADWLDIVTMCLLLGVHKGYTPEAREVLLQNALHYDNRKIFEILIKGGFNHQFTVKETGNPFIFETLKQPNPFYLKLLLKKGASPNTLDSEQNSVLFVAIREKCQEHLKELLKTDCDLNYKNAEGLTAVFYAVKVGNFEACELLCDTLDQKETPHTVEQIKVNEPLILNAKKPLPREELFLKMLQSKNKDATKLLKNYFKNATHYYIEVTTGVEIYARLSVVETLMEKFENTSQVPHEILNEEDCKKGLYQAVVKKFGFTKNANFTLDKIYNEPKCIESFKSPCTVCSGQGSVTCTVCKGKKTETCPTCEGAGKIKCERCEGKLVVQCKTIAKYPECKYCDNGRYTCVRCNDKGKAPCPTCKGSGRARCTCPPDKKLKCPHCENGYVPLKNGMYKKCTHCKEGYICELCQGTGLINEKFTDPEYVCKSCHGKKTVLCPVCHGKKKLVCNRAFEEPCDCDKGMRICQTCEGHKTVDCRKCEGTGLEKCAACEEGYVYSNVSVNFSATQKLEKEAIIAGKEGSQVLGEMLESVPEKVCAQDKMIEKLYTLLKVDLKSEDFLIRNNHMQQEVGTMVNTKEKKGALNALEIVPLYYTDVIFKEVGNTPKHCLLVGDVVYKVYEEV
jgi:hypothetical protein